MAQEGREVPTPFWHAFEIHALMIILNPCPDDYFKEDWSLSNCHVIEQGQLPLSMPSFVTMIILRGDIADQCIEMVAIIFSALRTQAG